MHSIWNKLRRQKNEKDWHDEKSFERWLMRAKESGVPVPREVAEQWLFAFIDEHDVLEEYLDIDLTTVIFKQETWDIETILQIKPGEYGEEGRYLPVIKELKNINGKIEKSPYGHINSVVKSWLNEGTWRVPPIVLDSRQWEGYKTPYHLVEGYTRLAWIHYYANHPDNSSGVKLRNKHSVWLITMKN